MFPFCTAAGAAICKKASESRAGREQRAKVKLELSQRQQKPSGEERGGKILGFLIKATAATWGTSQLPRDLDTVSTTQDTSAQEDGDPGSDSDKFLSVSDGTLRAEIPVTGGNE